MTSSPPPRIFYRVPDYAEPSWGVGLLYHHFRVLREAGFDARVLHRQAPFRLGWLDLDVPVREAAILARPMAPLCRPDCKGLCPVCGADRNAGPCAHSEEKSHGGS